MAKHTYIPQIVKGRHLVRPEASEPQGKTDGEPPAFCFKHTQNGYDITDLENNEKIALLDKIDKLSKRTWSMIKHESRFKNGSEIIARNSLRKPTSSAISQDEQIIAFHLPALFRMLGWRAGRLFHILWLDRKGELYKH